eukprot:TRINITY_DN59117_c0_g2_i1.p1 TRINITY_DN59117_c0_g2~~TRINITY_DN59117_c0_g2_i1.p1  ORF type:complete len:339 (-),score=53.08 TRINITY_DN59117_c0_g2_i1:145-1131(-)
MRVVYAFVALLAVASASTVNLLKSKDYADCWGPVEFGDYSSSAMSCTVDITCVGAKCDAITTDSWNVIGSNYSSIMNQNLGNLFMTNQTSGSTDLGMGALALTTWVCAKAYPTATPKPASIEVIYTLGANCNEDGIDTLDTSSWDTTSLDDNTNNDFTDTSSGDGGVVVVDTTDTGYYPDDECDWYSCTTSYWVFGGVGTFVFIVVCIIICSRYNRRTQYSNISRVPLTQASYQPTNYSAQPSGIVVGQPVSDTPARGVPATGYPTAAAYPANAYPATASGYTAPATPFGNAPAYAPPPPQVLPAPAPTPTPIASNTNCQPAGFVGRT